RPFPHHPAAPVQTAAEPPVGTPLPVRAELLGVRDDRDRALWRPQGGLDGHAPAWPMSSAAPRRPRSGPPPDPAPYGTTPMTDTLIVNAGLVNEGREFDGDLRIRGGRIDEIGSGLAARDGEHVVDAAGRRLLPGMIDDQVHFREPGMEYKADIASESAAAVAGGLTSFM